MKGVTKKSRKLPSRAALLDVARSEKRLSDYGKATPMSAALPSPSLVQMSRKPPRVRA